MIAEVVLPGVSHVFATRFSARSAATRSAPPAPELLDACDRLGFLVFDCWAKGKVRNDYHRFFADWHAAGLRAFVRRDRNHASVVMWSIGNEVIEQWGADGHEAWKLTTRLAGIVRAEDRSRADQSGTLTLRAESGDLATATCSLESR